MGTNLSDALRVRYGAITGEVYVTRYLATVYMPSKILRHSLPDSVLVALDISQWTPQVLSLTIFHAQLATRLTLL